MHSLDEPLDLKLSISKLRAAREKRDRALTGAQQRSLRQELHIHEDGTTSMAPASPASPPMGFLSSSKFREKGESRFTNVPVIDLSLSPHSGMDSPGGTSLSPERLVNGDIMSSCTRHLHSAYHLKKESFQGTGEERARTRRQQKTEEPLVSHHCWDYQSLRYVDGLPSSFQFFLPLGSSSALQLPSSVFITPPKEKRLSPELSMQKQLVCRWAKCDQLFDLLQDLVDHVNDYHVKPEKEAGYCCHWEDCARRGRGFNARYKMLIHIRTHTNEKPHRCPTCNKSFSRLENLKIHNRSHTGEKPYICPYEGCNKRYSNSSDRFKHTRTHYVDKPYYCKMPGCHKRYTDPSSLRKHIKAHGHFVSHEQQEMLKIHQPSKSPLTSEVPYVNGAPIIIPNPAAIFGNHGLPGLGASLPIPIAPAPLDLSTLTCGSGGSTGLAGLHSPMLSLNGTPLNLAKSHLLSAFAAGGLGLPIVSLLTGSCGGVKPDAERCLVAEARASKGQGLEEPKDSCERTEVARLRPTSDGFSLLPGTVLDLSTGINPMSSPESLPPGWVVIPPGSVLLKPAVVN